MRHAWTCRLLRYLAILMLTIASALLLASPTRAAAHRPQTGADTVTLSINNGTTFTYGGSLQPTFTAVVVFATKPTANVLWTISVNLEDGESFGGAYPVTSPDGMSLTFSNIADRITPPIQGGHHTAVAVFHNQLTGVTSTSNSVSFIMNKASLQLSCDFATNATRFIGAGQTLRMAMTLGSGLQNPPPWQGGTYTVTFDGPTHVTAANLVPDRNDEVMVTTPSHIGQYSLTCIFSGTTSYNPATYAPSFLYTFSPLHSLGTVRLYTNPTTLTAGQKMDFYVVFNAAPGLPIPTGQFEIEVGNYYSNPLQISADGKNLIHLDAIPSLVGVSQISIGYEGDICYNVGGANFPLTNPPIPGSTGSGGSGGTGGAGGSSGNGSSGNSPQATATPKATATGTASAQASGNTTTPTVGSAVGGGTIAVASTSASGDTTRLILIIILALLVVGRLGVTGVVIYWLRRSRSPQPNSVGPQDTYW